jgi:hypothetical protein
MFAPRGLYDLPGCGIYIFDRASQPIYLWSPVVIAGRGASIFWVRWTCAIMQRPEKPFAFYGCICAI